MSVSSNFSDEMAATRDDFDKAKWICQNRKYPADLPAELQAYQDTFLENFNYNLH